MKQFFVKTVRYSFGSDLLLLSCGITGILPINTCFTFVVSLVSKSSRQSADSVKLRAPIGLDWITGKIVIDWSYLLLSPLEGTLKTEQYWWHPWSSMLMFLLSTCIVIHAAHFRNLFRCSCHGVWRCVASNQSEVLPNFGLASFWTPGFSSNSVQTNRCAELYGDAWLSGRFRDYCVGTVAGIHGGCG